MVNNTNETFILDPFYVEVYDWTKHGLSIYMIISFVLGVPGNIIVMAVHYYIREKTVTDWMIFYIAFADVLSLINVPMYTLQFEGIWAKTVPNVFCKFNYFNSNSVSMASYMFCACTAVERYFKVVRSKEVFTVRQVKYLWLPIFVLSFGMGTVLIFSVNNNGNGHCMYDMEVRYLSTIGYTILLAVASLSSAVMIICYLQVCVFLISKMRLMKRYNESMSFSKSQRSSIQVTKMLAVVTCVFFFSANTPYISGVLFSSKRPNTEPLMSIMLVCAILFFINNFINPFLYMAMSVTFRSRAKAVFKKCCLCSIQPIRKVKLTESSSSSVFTVASVKD